MMKAFDSIKMGHRSKDWSLQSDDNVLPSRVIWRGTSVEGQQWIVNACSNSTDVLNGSEVVLDGGPRWVLSTALGFVTGGVWWTLAYAALFALANYAMYSVQVDASGGSDDDNADVAGVVDAESVDAPAGFSTEVSGIVAYTILAVAISLASVPGPWRLSEWKSFVPGLVVEVFLCLCVTTSAGIVHEFFGSYLSENPGVVMWADLGRWSFPAVVWRAAAKVREMATQEIKIKLSGLWCVHPMGESAERLNQVGIDSLWNDWARNVQTCAARVGGHGMLGFSAADLKVLSRSSPTLDAERQISLLLLGATDDDSTVEPWVRRSLAFMAGYDLRLTIRETESAGVTIQMHDVQRVISSLNENVVSPEVQLYRQKIARLRYRERYAARPDDGDDDWFFAGVLMADSDLRSRIEPAPALELAAGSYGCRFAVSISVLAKGTDPVARLACYADMKIPHSGVRMLSRAIVMSTYALVSGVAVAAGVQVDLDVVGERGLAFAECGADGAKSLSYSPDELAAASHLAEVIAISDDTFSPSSGEASVFENLWGGSAGVEKKVDVRDLVPSAGSAGVGASAFRGWLCHLGFTLAMAAIFLTDKTKALLVLVLVAVPANDPSVSSHMDNHFYMIYINHILNYARFVTRWTSLAQRGKHSVVKANKFRDVAFCFVNVLPVAACFAFQGWIWLVAFSPCVLANVPGLLNTLWYGWASAFEFEWWSWHVPNRWFQGRGYLELAGLRNRVGRNVLVVNAAGSTMSIRRVVPADGPVFDDVRFVVVGGGSLRILAEH